MSGLGRGLTSINELQTLLHQLLPLRIRQFVHQRAVLFDNQSACSLGFADWLAALHTATMTANSLHVNTLPIRSWA